MLGRLAGVSDGGGAPIAQDPEARDLLNRLSVTTAPQQGFQRIGYAMTRDQVAGLFGREIGGTWGMAGPAPYYGQVDVPTIGGGGPIVITPTPTAPLSLLDMVPSFETDARSIPYLQRLSPSGGGTALADVQEPGAVKQASGLEYTDEEATVVVVASWAKCNKVDLSDVEQLLADVSQALAYGIRTKVEQLLIQAVLESNGILEPNVSGEANLADVMVELVARLRASGVQPNVVAADPLALAAMAKLREDQDGAYLLGSPFAAGGPLAGIRPLPSSALEPGVVVASDTRISARIAVRDGLTISVGESDDDFLRNRVSILAETRVAVLPLVPSAWATADTSA